MRRIALSTLAVALTLGTASIAAAQQPTQAPQAQQQRAEGQGRWQRQGQHARRALFKGVNLTAQQKEQIKAIHQKYNAQAKPIRDALRPAAQQARADRQKGDQGAARAELERTKPQREQLRSLREQELREVRGVLTPDQQKTFDRNVEQLKARMEKWQHDRQNRTRQGA